jgi:hypothetical protein
LGAEIAAKILTYALDEVWSPLACVSADYVGVHGDLVECTRYVIIVDENAYPWVCGADAPYVFQMLEEGLSECNFWLCFQFYQSVYGVGILIGHEGSVLVHSWFLSGNDGYSQWYEPKVWDKVHEGRWEHHCDFPSVLFVELFCDYFWVFADVLEIGLFSVLVEVF